MFQPVRHPYKANRDMPRPKKNNKKPTQAELQILEVLWDHGPCTVRQVYEQLNASREMGYTTALKLMQIMASKDLVARDETDRTHIYRARITRRRTQKQLIADLVARAFGGSMTSLIAQTLFSHKPTPAELDEIERMIRQYRKEQHDE